MGLEKTPRGAYGARYPSFGPLSRFLSRMMIRQHRRSGNTFQGMDLMYLTTTGAKSGQPRQTAVSYFPADGDDGDGWLIVASAGGAARNPAWYHNIAAHPDQVWIDVAGEQVHVAVEQLDGDARAQAWSKITADQPRYAGYQQKTDRTLPVLKLTRMA
jgi:deazaflavin-dependent oxidoreductase (nitroreductase family)